MEMLARIFLTFLAASPTAWADESITIVHKTLELEQEYVLQVTHSLEYILQFVPSEEQSAFPLRVWLRSDVGDVTHPLLLTARQRTGAVTWQLPYRAGAGGRGGGEGGPLLRELQRTLCLDEALHADPTDCADAGSRRGALSLHVTSSCAAPGVLRVRVQAARDWLLPGVDAAPLHLTASMAAPHVSLFRFPTEGEGEEEGGDSVRLVVSSPDDLCATIAVQPYTCPIAQTFEDIEQSVLRMTVLRSGGVQLSRSRYPLGFYVVALVPHSDAACSPGAEQEAPPDWLWDSVWQERPSHHAAAAPRARLKRLSYEIKPALTRRQYAVGASVTLGVFLAFYVAFGLLVLAERWPRWYRCVRPRAVLADPAGAEAGAMTEPDASGSAPAATRRRDSAATFDSSELSDTESEGEPAPAAPPPPVDGESGPFGLPARLRVSALARRRARVLRARSRRYLYALGTVAVFYSLPVLQFVIAFQVVLNVSGTLDLCYYNFLCAHPLGALSDFNHVLSNLGYLLLGVLFVLQLRRRVQRRRRQPRHEEYGIPAHYGLSAALGAGLCVVGLLSASYHVCPNALNFQFDTAFMYVLGVLSMVKIYQSRHPDVNARAHATFGVLAVLIALVVWGVLGGGPLFWSVFTVLHVFSFLLLSLRIYYVGQFRLEKASVVTAAAWIRGGAGGEGGGAAPLYTARLVALVVANAVNWAFAIYGLVYQSANIASHLLFVVLSNALLHMLYYLGMKLLHGERPRWYAWLQLGGAALAWAPALYFFTSGSSDWAASPAQSRLLNHECRALRFYDAHDLWHLLSALALYLTFNAMLTWDDGLAAVKRTDIPVF